jgi:2-polyprenyl-6-methoxyphenol hydroxylase-like FAD-dependent oxidoreductase
MAVSNSAGTQMFFRDSELQLLAERDDAKVSRVAAEDIERRGIGRAELRDILLDGLANDGNPCVHWSKTFDRYDSLPNGQVRAYFKDNTVEEGDLLVGADGVQSAIRQQYLPHIQRLDLGIHAIAGRCVLSEELRATLPPDLINGSLNNIVPSGKGWMFVSSWTLPPSNRIGDATEMAPYIVWAYVVPAEDDSTFISSREASQLLNFVLAGIESWSPRLRNLVAKTDLSAVSCISLRSMPFLEPWSPSNITVLGDAIHNMTPMAGVGANTALRDAELLTEMLALAASQTLQLDEAIGHYESEMRGYANEAVSLSKRNAVSASSGRGLQRWMFRMLLRAAQASPFVMRQTIGRGVIAAR